MLLEACLLCRAEVDAVLRRAAVTAAEAREERIVDVCSPSKEWKIGVAIGNAKKKGIRNGYTSRNV